MKLNALSFRRLLPQNCPGFLPWSCPAELNFQTNLHFNSLSCFTRTARRLCDASSVSVCSVDFSGYPAALRHIKMTPSWHPWTLIPCIASALFDIVTGGGELQSHGAREKTKRRQRWEALCSMCTKIQFNTVCTNRYMSSRSNWSGKMCLWGLADIKENGKGNCVKEKRRECAVNSGVTCAFIKAAGEKYWTHSGRQNNEACQILDIVT